MLKKLLKDNVSDIDDDNIDKLSRMILQVTACAFCIRNLAHTKG